MAAVPLIGCPTCFDHRRSPVTAFRAYIEPPLSPATSTPLATTGVPVKSPVDDLNSHACDSELTSLGDGPAAELREFARSWPYNGQSAFAACGSASPASMRSSDAAHANPARRSRDSSPAARSAVLIGAWPPMSSHRKISRRRPMLLAGSQTCAACLGEPWLYVGASSRSGVGTNLKSAGSSVLTRSRYSRMYPSQLATMR